MAKLFSQPQKEKMERVIFPKEFFYHLTPRAKQKLLVKNIIGFSLAVPLLAKSIKDQPLSNIKFVPVGIFLADVIGYLLHAYTDETSIKNSGTPLDNLRIQNQYHHTYPMKLLEKPLIYQATETFPFMFLFGAASFLFSKSSPTRLLLGLIGLSSPFQNTFHGCAHKQTHGLPVPSWVSFLQHHNLIISGQEHRKHHVDEHHEGHWSVLTPLSNHIMDPVFEFFLHRTFPKIFFKK